MMDRLALALPTFAVVAATLYACRRRSPFEPAVLLVATTALVATFFPLLSAAFEPWSWRHGAHLADSYVLSAQAQYLAFTVALCAVIGGVRLTRPRGGDATRRPADHPLGADYVRFRDTLVAVGLVLGGALLYAIYVAKVGLGPLMDRDNFAEKYRVSSGLGTLYAGLNIVIAGCLWAEASELPRRVTAAFRACAALVLVWALAVVAVRTYAAALFLGYLYLYCKRSGFTLGRVRPSIVVALVLGYVGIEAYALARSVWTGNVTDALSAVVEEGSDLERTLGQVVGGSEFSHPFLTLMELERFEEPGELRGSSYAGAVAGLVPLWLLPDRPPSIAETFARSHYPELTEKGGGTALSMVGEAWWNGGAWTGPLLLGFLLGHVLMWLQSTIRWAPDGVLARFAPYTIHLALLLHRNTFASFVKQLFLVALPLTALALTALFVWRTAGARRARAAGVQLPHGEVC